MSISLSIKSLVIIIISIVILILGIALVAKLAIVSKELPVLPNSLLDSKDVLIIPSSSQQGTEFFIKVFDYSRKESQNLQILISGEGYQEFVDLYDDGKHQDENSGDSIYGGFFDSTAKPLGEYRVLEKNFSVYESGCEVIKGNFREDNINFVILSSNYSDYADFKNDALEILNSGESFMNFEPFKSNSDKFFFTLVNSQENLGCDVGCKGIDAMVCCNTQKVFEEASQCGFDNVFILINDSSFCGSASNYAKICAKNENKNIILMHELGHSFGDLADEYVYQDVYEGYDIGEIDLANCDDVGCDKWAEISGECYPGCSYSSLYKSVESHSIMLDLFPEYNLVSQNQILKIIENSLLNKETIERNLPSKSYFVNLGYSSGDIEINEVFLKPIKTGIEVRDSKYVWEIRDKDDRLIFKNNFKVPNIILPINSSSPIILDNVNFPILLPYSENSEKLLIYEGDLLLDEKSLDYLSDSCGDNICEDNENHVSCPDDCLIDNDDFCEESLCDPNCESQKNCRIIESSKKISSVLLILGGFFLVSFIIYKIWNKNKLD